MDIDFAILTALPEERDAVLKSLDLSLRHELGTQTYYSGKLINGRTGSTVSVVMTMLESAGNTTSAAATSRLTEHWTPSHVLMVGIAGGVKGTGTGLGDVVVGRDIIYYELGKTKPGEFSHAYQQERADPYLLNRAMNMEACDWSSRIRTPRPIESDNTSREPVVLFGPIACGEKVVTDPADIAELQKSYRAVMAIETESWGVVQALRTLRPAPGFLAIRGVSDYADPQKNDKWHEYAAEAAAQFSRDLIVSVAAESAPTAELVRSSQSAVVSTSATPPKAPTHVDDAMTVRQSLLLGLSAEIADSRPEGVWLWGLPGIGKTHFAYALAQKIRPNEPVFHVVSRLEEDSSGFVDSVKSRFSDEWWNATIARAHDSKVTPLTDAISALVNSGATLIVEHSEPYLDASTWNPCKSLIDAFLRSGGGPRLICTAHSALRQPDSGFVTRQVPDLSIPEARELIRTRVNMDDNLCERIRLRYGGHTLAIYHIASAIGATFGRHVSSSQVDRLLEEIPADVSSVLESRIAQLSLDQQGWLAAMASMPEGVVEAAVPPNQLEPLTGAGLVGRLPALQSGRSIYAVHQLIGEVAASTVPSQAVLAARKALLKRAYENGILQYGPELVLLYLDSNEPTAAVELLLADGRWWIEVAGIDRCLPAFERAASSTGVPAPAALYFAYLHCVGVLFSGEYGGALKMFDGALAGSGRGSSRLTRWICLLSPSRRVAAAQTDALLVLMSAESHEAERRLGNVDRALVGFRRIRSISAHGRLSLSPLEAEARGVVLLLLGNLLRQLGCHREALSVYEQGQRMLRTQSGSKACELELHHCQYAASMCRLLLGQEFAPFVSATQNGSVHDSEFLQGLWQLLLAQDAITLGDYQRGRAQAGEAREHFRRFQSPAYAMRAECIVGVAEAMAGDNTGARVSLTRVKDSAAAPRPAKALAAVGLLALDPGTDMEHNAESLRAVLQPLLTSGAIVTARSALILVQTLCPELYATDFAVAQLRVWQRPLDLSNDPQSSVVECTNCGALIGAIDQVVGRIDDGRRAFML